METGGRAAKLGIDFERLWAIQHALEVLRGQYQSLLWEPVGEDEKGVDLWITHIDGHREAHQLKRQNRDKGSWTVADLRREGILQHARAQLDRDLSAQYVFVSSCVAPHLQTITEQSRRANNDPIVFHRDLVSKNRDRSNAFAEVMANWGFDPEKPDELLAGFRFLQRMEFVVQDPGARFRRMLEQTAGAIVDGRPAEILRVLGNFLDGNLGHDLHMDDIRSCLKREGLNTRELAGDPTLPAAIEALQDRFDKSIASSLIAGAPIHRPEVDQLISSITKQERPHIIFVHGQASAGKSVAVHQMFLSLRAAGVPCLPLRLDIWRPEGHPYEYGRSKLLLPASPASSLRAFAGNRTAVLLLDQLDALRWTSINSHGAWDACAAIIEEAIADTKSTVVVTCRTFDLENDPKIAEWKRSKKQPDYRVEDVRIGDLPEKAVSDLLSQKDVKFASLPIRQQQLLRQPGPLALWWHITSVGKTPPHFENVTQLIQQDISLRKQEAVRNHDVPERDVNECVRSLVSFMDENGRLDAPEALFDSFVTSVAALCSVGLIKRECSSLAFLHQSYFDYLVAAKVYEDAMRKNRSVLPWLKANQSLFRRDQFRQLLTLLRDSDPMCHESILRDSIRDPDVRFHLKHLIFGLLRQSDPPLDHELRLVAELTPDRKWWSHLQATVFWSRPAWFDALYDQGTLKEWLSTWSDEDSLRELIQFLRSAGGHRPDAIDQLLAPYWNRGAEWTDRLESLFGFDPSDDTPVMAQYRLQKIRQGDWRINDIYLDRLAVDHPTRVVPLLEAIMHAWFTRLRDVYKGNADGELPRWPIREDQLETEVLAAVRTDAHKAWSIFSKILRSFVKMQRILDRRKLRNQSLEDLGGPPWQAHHRLTDATEFVEQLVTEAVRGLAAESPGDLVEILKSTDYRKAQDLERAMAKGLLGGVDSLADQALAWLCDKPSRFRLGRRFNEIRWEPARDLIARFAPHSSDEKLADLERAILKYHEEWEYMSFKHQLEPSGRIWANDWGRAQNVLLSALPANRMSVVARHTAGTWRRKFGDPALETPDCSSSIGGQILSPIPTNRLTLVSDREWLRIIGKKWPDSRNAKWRQIGHEIVGEASIRHFAEALGEAAKQDPQRFGRLALRMPSDSDPAYFEHLLRGIGDKWGAEGKSDEGSIARQEIETVIEHIGDCQDAGYVMTVCRLVGSHSETRWDPSIVRRIIGYANHPEPRPDGYTCYRQDPGDRSIPDIAMTSINCARGCVASTVTSLLWTREDMRAELIAVATRLLQDPHPAVRHEALGACVSILNIDKDLALSLFAAACNHEDDRVLDSRWVGRFISYTRSTNHAQLLPIISRMANSEVGNVAQAGASWVTACSIDDGAFASLAQECRTGSQAQRLGVTNTAVQLYAANRNVNLVQSILVEMFDDSESEIRSQAGLVFRYDGVFDLDQTVALASNFVLSAAFLDDPGYLLHPLAEYAGSLTPYWKLVIDSSKMVTEKLADQTRDLRTRLAYSGDEISTLLIRLYEASYGTDKEIETACLDQWDNLLENRVGLTEKHLKQLDD